MIRLYFAVLLVAGTSFILLLGGSERESSSPTGPSTSTPAGTVAVAEPDGPMSLPPSPPPARPPAAARSFDDCLQARDYQAASGFLYGAGASHHTLGAHGTQVIEDFVSDLRLATSAGASPAVRRSASSRVNVLEEIIEKSSGESDVVYLATRLRESLDNGDPGEAVARTSFLIKGLLRSSETETRKKAYCEVGQALERYVRDPRHLDRKAPAQLLATMSCVEAVKFFEERCSVQDPIWRACVGLRTLDESGQAALLAWYFNGDYDSCMILGPFIASLGDKVRSSFREQLLKVAGRRDRWDYSRLFHGILGVAQNWSSHEDLRWMEDFLRVFSADERSVLQMLDASLENRDDLLALVLASEPAVSGSLIARWCEAVRERQQSR